MVLNYYTTNYSGWPSPAFYYATKLQKIFEITKYSCYYFVNIFPNINILIYINNTARFPLVFLRCILTTIPPHPKKCYEASQQKAPMLAHQGFKAFIVYI